MKFFKKPGVITLIFFIFIAVFFGYSYFIERNIIVVEKQEIGLKCLNFSLGANFIQISDLHFGKATGEKRIAQIYSEIEKLNPDFVFITGDIIEVNEGVRPAGELVKKLSSISKVYAVFGNWDYFILPYKINELKKELEDSGAKVLINQIENLKIGDSEINLMGLKYPYLGETQEGNLDKMLAGFEAEKMEKNCSILLSHSPEIIEKAKEKGIDLILSGHNHGGQVKIPIIWKLFLPVKESAKKFISGLYKESLPAGRQGETKIYVNRGLGTSTLPLRFLALPEITLINLKKI